MTDEAAAAVERNTESEIRVIADLDNVAVGIGVLAPDALELRACYVRPDTVRRGIGTAIVRELERIAIGFGSTSLHLHASLNAVQFYGSLGYEITGPCQHVFRSGERMAACAMRRGLTAVRG